MRILLSNDDGVHAIGLSILADELAKIAEVVVVAPDRNRSGASNSLSIQVPVRVNKMPNNFYSVTGTPTDCVHLALTGFFTDKFDMVVSGINAGENMGDDVLYSGTVAAAFEGRTLGLPAIAVSLAGKEQHTNFSTAALVVRQIVERLKEAPLPAGTILNVNVPDMYMHDLRGFEVTRLGTRHAAQPAVKMLDPRGQTVFWMGAAGAEADAGLGTDFFAIRSGMVSITPLQVDMTNYMAFGKISAWTSGLVLCKE
ncbi:MAG: 5'/3'-nucleotidase SurE [Gammaproteobacteria bacterium]|nr:5'/3'-nucleotidase SurE [Gammaproteobacteria bacterium]